ncbi:restless-like transposase [Hirsutella rhossiliensis]
METDVPTKPQRASDGGSSSKSFVNMDALQDEWSIFPWNHFPAILPRKENGTSRIICSKSTGLSICPGRGGARSWERNQDKTPSKNIVEMLNLNASDPKEQGIANALIQRFDKDHFQRLLLEWVVDANVSFRQPEHCRLRHIFEYLNPSVAVTNAHISHDTVRKRIVDLYTRYKTCVIDNLKSTRAKFTLRMPELKISHSGENIAAQILEILESYEILDKVGYITLDNAGNMDTATEEIAEALGFDPKKRRVRCFGHVLNLVVKALLFGHKADAFEAEINGEPVLDAVQHEIWRKKGPVGKLHNLVNWIHQSDKLTYRLRALQEESFHSRTTPRKNAAMG